MLVQASYAAKLLVATVLAFSFASAVVTLGNVKILPDLTLRSRHRDKLCQGVILRITIHRTVTKKSFLESTVSWKKRPQIDTYAAVPFGFVPNLKAKGKEYKKCRPRRVSFPFLKLNTMSHHCHDEHCDHDHEDLPEAGEQFLLYSKIDRDNVRCLNEAEPGMGKNVIKPWNERYDNSKVRKHAFFSNS